MGIISTITAMQIPGLDHWGYFLILLVAFLESSPIFGVFVPGQTTISIGGFFAKLGHLNIYAILFTAFTGGILGNLLGYTLGKRYGHSFLTRYGKYFLFKETYYRKIRELMQKHPGKALVFGRYNPVTRSFAPFVAGASDIRFRRFLMYNIIGAAAWATVFTMLGWIFGASYEIATKYFNTGLLMIVGAAVLGYAIYRFVTRKEAMAKGKTEIPPTLHKAVIAQPIKQYKRKIKHGIKKRREQRCEVRKNKRKVQRVRK